MSKLSKEDFSEMIIKNQVSMYRLAMSILKNTADAEDTVSESILKAYEHLASLKKRDSFRAWIMTIVANESKLTLRKRGRVNLCDEMDFLKEQPQGGTSEVWDAVMALKEEHSKVVILYYYEGFSTKEVSRILHIPEGTVKSRLSRARNELRIMIQ